MTEAHLESYIRREDGQLLLALDGTLDLDTSERTRGILLRHIEEHGPNVVLDTSRLNFIDSKGVGVLLEALKAARQGGGTIYMQNPTLPVRKILDTCGLTSLFPPPPAREKASAPAAPAAAPARSTTRTTRRP
ncbi:MAG: STAS domain-containing protein [Armatimonadota bacterium]